MSWSKGRITDTYCADAVDAEIAEKDARIAELEATIKRLKASRAERSAP